MVNLRSSFTQTFIKIIKIFKLEDIFISISYSHYTFTKYIHVNETIEPVQCQATLAITGAIQGTSRDKIYQELGSESLKSRR